MPAPWRINLGGEGEVPGVLNQQGRWVVLPGWGSSAAGQSLEELVNAGHDLLIADNVNLPIPDESFDEVITKNIPPVNTVNRVWGPTVQTSEIQRILKSGGRWIHDGVVQWVKP